MLQTACKLWCIYPQNKQDLWESSSHLKAILTGRGCRDEFDIAARWAYKTTKTKQNRHLKLNIFVGKGLILTSPHSTRVKIYYFNQNITIHVYSLLIQNSTVGLTSKSISHGVRPWNPVNRFLRSLKSLTKRRVLKKKYFNYWTDSSW